MGNVQFQLTTLAKVMRAFWDLEGDLFVCVSGNEGSGKSTFAYWLAKLIQPDFNVTTQTVYKTELGNDLLLKAPPRSVIWMDENLFYKRDHAKKPNKWSNKILQRARFKKRVYLCCSPRLGDLDEYMRNHRVKLWFKVVERGRAEVYQPVETELGDPWNLDDPRKRKVKNKMGYVLFDKMEEEADIAYQQVKQMGFEELRVEYEKEMGIYDDNGDNGSIVAKKKELTQKEIIEQFTFTKTIIPKITQKQFAAIHKVSYHKVTNALKTV